MEKTNKKAPYEMPKLTVVSFRAERGYASSSIMSSLKFWEWQDGGLAMEDQNHVEVYTTGNGWNEGSNHFWD